MRGFWQSIVLAWGLGTAAAAGAAPAVVGHLAIGSDGAEMKLLRAEVLSRLGGDGRETNLISHNCALLSCAQFFTADFSARYCW